MKTEKNKLQEKKSVRLTAGEWWSIELALEGHIEMLRNRYEEEEKYVHPAKHYEELLEKLKDIPF